jgi:hypothetical protein
MLKPLKLPRGVLNIFAINNSSKITITQDYEHRPDKIFAKVNKPSMRDELVDNYMSNISPISLSKGDSYVVTDTLFKGYFANV